MKIVFVHLAEGFEEIEAVTIIDVLRRAGLTVKTVSISGNYAVKGAHSIEIIADQLFEEVNYDNGDMIVLPGGMPGAQNLNEHQGLNSQIMNYHNQGKYLAAICAAPLVFGNLGILKGKKAVCYPGFESYLTEALITYDPVQKDGLIITGRGVGAALEFALEIVRCIVGEESALKLSKAMLVND
jgi:protein deglycase